MLRHAVGNHPPRSFDELVARLDKRALQRAARDNAESLDAIRALPDKDVAGVRARYDGIAWAVGTTLDGTWSYEDTHAAYVPVGRPENRHQAAEVGAPSSSRTSSTGPWPANSPTVRRSSSWTYPEPAIIPTGGVCCMGMPVSVGSVRWWASGWSG